MRLALLAVCILLSARAATAQLERPWLDANLPTEARVTALLAAMTLEEKAAQMRSAWRKKPEWMYRPGDLALRPDSLRAHFPHGLGQVTRPSDGFGGDLLTREQTIDLTNRLQRYFVEETRLGIPVFFHEEALHGFAAQGGTSYPQPIALAGSFDTAMVREVFRQIAGEVRSFGAHQVLTPVLDVCRDPRWGRVEETYGEDPFLVAEIAKAAVGGFQGTRDYDGRDSARVLATLKHLTGHGIPEGGNNIGPAFISRRLLREVFLYPFKTVIEAERPGSLMASYNEIDGVPSHANRWMMREWLRGEAGFEGFVVSDYFALRELHESDAQASHHVARDAYEACVLGLRTGINIELPDGDVYLEIPRVVRDGAVDEAVLDELLRPMLAAKFEFGLFEQPYAVARAPSERELQRARDLARTAAVQSMVLLQNRDDRLPLRKTEGLRIAAIGPNMDRELLGGYSGKPLRNVTVLQGLRDSYDDVAYAKGVSITTTSGWGQDSVAFPSYDADEAMIREAEAVAKTADVIVLAIGGNEQTSREAWADNHLGDRPTLELVGRQNDLVDRLAATGKPIVALVFGGRPLALQNVLAKCDAVIQCWYLGQETGVAVSNVLQGRVSPSAKLAISFPRSAGHIPAYYSKKPSADRGYLADETSALLPFGHGLTYSSFDVSAPRLNKTTISPTEGATVSVDVTNTGAMRAAEVVQLYIRDEFATVTRPIRELKGFARVSLAPGERRTVQIPILPRDLSMYDIDMDYVVEPGDFTIMTGTSSDPTQLQSTTLTVRDASGKPARRPGRR